MNFVNKVKLDYIVQALTMIVIGIVLIIWTQVSLDMMARVLALLLFIIGIIFILSYILKSERGFIDSGQLLSGILISAIGVWIFLNPGTFTDFIPKLFGLFILLSGIMNLSQTLSLIKYHYSLWWLSLIFAVITVALGAYLLFNPTDAKEIAVRVIGIFLVYDGVSNLWTVSRVAKFSRKAQQQIRDAEAVDVDATIIDVEDTSRK